MSKSRIVIVDPGGERSGGRIQQASSLSLEKANHRSRSTLRAHILVVHLLLLMSMATGCALPMSTMALVQTAGPDLSAARSSLAPGSRLQPYLHQLALVDPDDTVRVIVQHHGEATPVIEQLKAVGGTVINELSMINALVITAPAGKLPTLAGNERVRWIALDAPVRKSSATDGSAFNARDDFDEVAFNGSSGALPWSSDWLEIGEADGPAAGDVMVTRFWGGALQGLRLQESALGVMRSVDLGVAQAASLGLAYRRKDFSEQDYITVEVSQDGGASWQEVTRLAGPTTDPAIQYGDFPLPVTSRDKTAVDRLLLRFMTAPTMSADAGFYLDAVDIRLNVKQTTAVEQINQIYLPLIAGGGDTAQDASANTARSKAEEIAEVSAAGTGCYYNCINLNALQSTFIKAIGADQLWNVSPFIRGWDVTVAVVDSGIAPHPDLNDYYGNSRLLAHVNFVADSDVPDDFYGHGTHVAGTIAGLGVSSGGAYPGVAPEAKIVDVKVTDDYGMGNTSDVVAGLQWIYENRNNYNIKVANLSLNSTVPESYHVSALDAALEVLWFNKITVVVSSGNQGKEKLYPPANDPFAIVVGSIDDNGTADIADDKLSNFSTYGLTSDGFAKPDIVAPGQNIVSLLASDDMNLTKLLPLNSILGSNNRYFKMSGTSMASAVVAGAVALLLEDEPTLTPDQVKYRLMATARPLSVNEGYCATGAGMLDIKAAVYGNGTQSANTNIQASQLLWSGANPVTWGSVSWNSVSWNSVSWNSVSWNSVSWNSVSWNSVSWNSNSNGNDGSTTASDCGTAFKQFTLVNAQTNQDIRPLYNNAIIDLDRTGTSYLTVRADVVGPVESVKFDVEHGGYVKVENLAPYALYGDSNGSYAGTTFYPGSYDTTLSAYANDNAHGKLLITEDYQMFIVADWFTPRLHSVKSGQCIEASSTYWEASRQFEQNYCGWSNRQKFRIEPVANKTDVVNLINRQYGYCLDVTGNQQGDGADVIQWRCHGGENQQFRLKGLGYGKFQIVAVHSGKCIAVENGSTRAGADLVQQTCDDNATHQQWRFN